MKTYFFEGITVEQKDRELNIYHGKENEKETKSLFDIFWELTVKYEIWYMAEKDFLSFHGCKTTINKIRIELIKEMKKNFNYLYSTTDKIINE